MDFVGIAMGMVTIPMALLTMGSLAGALVLVATGGGALVAAGLLGFGLCFLVVPLLERIVITTDDAAVLARLEGRSGAARARAVMSAGIPMAVLLGWHIAVFDTLVLHRGGAPVLAAWLWSYAVATGPWTLFALQVSRFRRTLCGIRAYAGHLAYWLLAVVPALGGSPAAALPLMLVPAVLPFTVGFLLALADRDALTNVRV